MKIYGDIRSGNCYKVKLLATLLDIDHDWQHVDVLSGDTRRAEFLDKNPNGKLPTVELEDGRYLTESNAILNYLAEGSVYLPSDPYARAQVLRWQFFEQNGHEPFIAVARFINTYLGLPEDRRADYDSKQGGGHAALRLMEQQLEQTPYLTGDTMTIADISLYGYTHVAEEGGFDLNMYPAILSWIGRIQAHPRYIGMDAPV